MYKTCEAKSILGPYYNIINKGIIGNEQEIMNTQKHIIDFAYLINQL